jgi:hypothetical protein
LRGCGEGGEGGEAERAGECAPRWGGKAQGWFAILYDRPMTLPCAGPRG